MTTEQFDRALEEATGQSLEEVRRTPLDRLREIAQSKLGRPLKIVSAFPLIGRGSVMSNCVVNHEDAEAACDDAIQRLSRAK